MLAFVPSITLTHWVGSHTTEESRLNNHGIRARVLLLALLPLALVALALTGYSIQARQNDLERALEERSLAEARKLAHACEYGLFVGEQDGLLRQARLSQASIGASAVTISDPYGRELLRLGQVRLSTEWSGEQAQMLVKDAETLRVTAPVQQLPIEIGFAPAASAAGQVLGHVALEIPRRETIARQRQVMFTSLAVTALGLVLAGLLAWRLGRDIVRPINRLTEAVERIGAGDLRARVTVEAGGEFVVLERGINRMAAELQASYDTLQEKIRLATEELAWRADHDQLTGLLNRAAFDTVLHRALEAARAGQVHSLAYLDLDRFKQVNDTGGHLAGDELLRQFVAQVKGALNDGDRFARLGGDEFGILFADCDLACAERRARTLCQAINATVFHCLGQAHQIGVSIGLASLDQVWDDADHLMRAADAACYAAKHGGRGQVRIDGET